MSRGHRASTTPMDFEWQNKSGPVDGGSPFITAAANQSAKKRPHSVLDSPAKNGFVTPNRLRDPDNRAFFFSQQDSSKPLPSIPAHVQDAWTPRTPASTYDFSSGGETPNTPQLDSDVGTPDTQLAGRMGRLGNGETGSPKKAGGRRDSWFKRVFAGSPSPIKEKEKERERGRDGKEIALKGYSNKAENRIKKRRSERTERSRSKKSVSIYRDGEEGDSDTEQASAGALLATKDAIQETVWARIGGGLSWAEAHPGVPFVLSYYLQLTLNIFLGALFLYVIWAMYTGILADIDSETQKYLTQARIDIAACANEYTRNRCRPEEVVPAMEAICADWEACMNRNPQKVKRAFVTAKTFAQIINSFCEEISYKTLIFAALIIFGGFNLSNWAFGLLRSQGNQFHPHHQHTPILNEYIPQTPHRVPSNSYLANQENYTPGWGQGGYGPGTPYGGGRMRGIEAPPPLVHAQSMPAIPTAGHDGMSIAEGAEEKKGARKRGIFR